MIWDGSNGTGPLGWLMQQCPWSSRKAVVVRPRSTKDCRGRELFWLDAASGGWLLLQRFPYSRRALDKQATVEIGRAIGDITRTSVSLGNY